MSKENYYDVLKVKEDCSPQDIKKAFIELSKKYHPDVSDVKSDHKKFLKINEAYSILNKPAARRLYDQYLTKDDGKTYHQYYENIYTTRNDPAFWAHKEKHAGPDSDSYYSVKGVKRVSNRAIVFICFAFAAVGLGLEVLALRKSFTFDRERLNHESARNAILLEQAQSLAAMHGNKVQIQRFNDNKLLSSTMGEANEEYARRLRVQADAATAAGTV